MSRPHIPIDWEMAEALMAAGSPGTEIASFFGLHPDTFYRRVEEKYSVGFTELSAQKKATGEAVLRMHQYNKAVGVTKKGDNTLLIWLGKQRLNQRELPIESEVSQETSKNYHALISQLTALQQNAADSQSTQQAKTED